MAISHSFAFLFLFLLFTTMATAEKKAHLHFYLQGTVTGPNATLVTVAKTTPNATLFTFGSVSVLDDLLTEGQDRASKPVGRCQGLVAQAQLNGPPASVAAENFLFTSGEFNGSSLAMVGRVDPITGTFELAVVGGSGKFRMARGYALANFLAINTTAGTSLVEYNVYVLRQSF